MHKGGITWKDETRLLTHVLAANSGNNVYTILEQAVLGYAKNQGLTRQDVQRFLGGDSDAARKQRWARSVDWTELLKSLPE